jgi:hypothetical protein
MRRFFMTCTLGGAVLAFASSATAQPPTQPPAQPPAQPQQSQPPQPVGTTGTITTLPEPTPPLPMCVPPDMSTTVSLLDRAHRILDEAGKEKMGKVDLDRGGLDELRALVEQVRAAIAPVKQQ